MRKSQLKEVVFHANDKDKHMLELQFFKDKLFVSIEWAIKGGIRAESFELSAEEALRIANDIKESFGEEV